jgi:integrase
MKGVILDPKSPYYWIRCYDRSEQLPEKRRKKLNTKIEVTEADWKRFREAKKKGKGTKTVLHGSSELKKIVDGFRRGLARKNLEQRSGVKLELDKTLTEGYEEYKKVHSVPASKDFLKEKTLINYTIAVNHMIAACSDKFIYKYDEDDYIKLLEYFEKLKIPGKKILQKDGSEKQTFKKMSQNSRSIYTRSLRSLWKYFCQKNYAAKIIIEAVEPEEKDPAPIPLEEMFSILSYLKASKDSVYHYQLIYFMLLTGCRPSSAMVQLKSDISFKRKIITIQNIKTGKNKGKLTYKFPLYPELEKLLKEMNVKDNDSGRLFNMFTLNEVHYTYPLSFWERAIKVLNNAKSINDYYTLKQIRSTTASFLVNVKGINSLYVKRLLDHSDIKVTDKHYIEHDLKALRDELSDIQYEDFLP